MLKSLENGWKNGSLTLPRIFVLEVREKAAPTGEAISWLIVERVEKYVTYANESLVSLKALRTRRSS